MKNVLITGASSGIGLELARLYASKGYNIAVVARRIHLLEELKESLKSYNVKVYAAKCDVSKKDEVALVYEDIKENFGKIDIAILNSGIDFRSDIKDLDSKKGEELISINFFGVLYFFEMLIPDMKKNSAGIIAGVSSLADARGFSKSGFYCASKAALTTFLESMRIELQDYNIQVITIKPGFVVTEMTDKNKFYMPFLMKADKAARIIYKGISKKKKLIQFPQRTVWLIKLAKMTPNFIFDRMMKLNV